VRDIMDKGVIITALVLILGIALFIANDGIGRQQRMNGDIYTDMRIKTNYLGDDVKLFALANENVLDAYDAAQGAQIPAGEKMVLGSAEAQMMLDEKLIEGVGSNLNGFFGINITIGGILKNTSGPIDDMHFLTEEQFAAIQGEEGRVYVLLNQERMPKLFYRRGIGEETPLKIELAEGELSEYTIKEMNGKEYQPLIIGAAEAKMMREEKLFTAIGDRVDGFFGKDVVIVGVAKQTNTALDMMHIMP
jgi:hypothetical protein